MSRQPSPGPSQPHVAPQALPPPTNRQKSKTFTPGIAAGAEDVKYQAKYKELKRKVKEIETDNDKLQFKVLQAKKSINRMKIERAVLYDRLSQVPPSPDMNDRQPLPPLHSGPGVPPHHSPYMSSSSGSHQPRDVREHVPMDPNDRARVDYTHPSVRMGAGPDGRPPPVADMPMGPGVAPSTHTLSSVHSSRHHAPSSGHGSPHQLPPLSKMTPGQHLEPSRSHGQPHSYSPQMPPLPSSSSRTHSHSHSNSRSHSSSSRSRTHHPTSAPYPQHTLSHQHDGLSSAPHLGSPPHLGEREKSRRHEGHERAAASHSRHQVPVPKNPMHSPPGARMSTRMHHQQHIDRSPLSHNDLERERERELEMERDWEYDQRLIAREQFEREHITRERDIAAAHPPHRMSSPPFAYRSGRQATERPGDYHDHPSYKIRDEPGYHHHHRELPGPGAHSRLSRSGTPVSGSGSGLADGPPRPDSRGQYYDRERTRSYPSRHPPHEDDYVREERRAHSRDRSVGVFTSSSERPPYPEARKRHHHEMELDGGEQEGDVNSGMVGGSRKRVHQEHTSAHGADSQEEDGVDS